MREDTISKIHSVGKVSRIVSKIAKIVAAIGAIACLVLVIIGICMPKDFMHFSGSASGRLSADTDYVSDLETSLETETKKILGSELEIKVTETLEDKIQNLDIELVADDVTGSSFKLFLILSGIVGMLFSSALWFVMHFAMKLSKALETCKSPFEENVLAAMKKLGISLIPCGIITLVMSGISAIALIFIILVVMLFINIFKYGAELQQESDDTV